MLVLAFQPESNQNPHCSFEKSNTTATVLQDHLSSNGQFKDLTKNKLKAL